MDSLELWCCTITLGRTSRRLTSRRRSYVYGCRLKRRPAVRWGRRIRRNSIRNPCTLVPTDFQLYRKVKQILYSFFVLLCSKKTKLDFHFRFSVFPRREGNGILIHLMLSIFLFCNFWKKRIFSSVFRFRMEFGKRITRRFSFFVFGQWQWSS